MLDNILFLCHGAAISFFGCYMFYFIKLRGGIANRLQLLLGLIMSVWLVQCLKDIFFMLPAVTESYYLCNLLQLLDIVSIAPCMFLCLELVSPGWCTWRKLLNYEIPFVALIVLFAVVGAATEQRRWAEAVLMASVVYAALFSVYNIIKVIIRAKEFNRQLRNIYSYTENIDIHWMRGMLAMFFVFMALWSYSVYLNTAWINAVYYLSSIVLWSIIVFFINKQQDAVLLASNSDAEPSADSAITSEEHQQILEKWNAAMIDGQMYLNPHLTLVDMATAIGTNRNKLSHFVNSHFGVTFLDYVNALRIDHAEPLLHEPNAKILAISKLSGFCSQNTFYRYFKHRFGCTPGEYINNLNSK